VLVDEDSQSDAFDKHAINKVVQRETCVICHAGRVSTIGCFESVCDRCYDSVFLMSELQVAQMATYEE
jgi:cytochrome c551/c552